MAGELLAGPMVQTILAFRMLMWKRLHAFIRREEENITDLSVGYSTGQDDSQLRFPLPGRLESCISFSFVLQPVQ
jgi:hypothetical protein